MSVREVLDPLFENMALGYGKNDRDDVDWNAAVYNGIVGAFLGSTSNVVTRVNDVFNSNNSLQKLNPDEVVSGMWEDSPNSSKNNVEKSQLESVENVVTRTNNISNNSGQKLNLDEVISVMWEDEDNMIKIKYYNILTMVVAGTAAT